MRSVIVAGLLAAGALPAAGVGGERAASAPAVALPGAGPRPAAPQNTPASAAPGTTPGATPNTPPNRALAFKSEHDEPAVPLARVVVATVLALGVGAAVLVAYRRFAQPGLVPSRQTRRLRLVQSLRLGPRSALFLVELDGRTLLIGQQGETVTVLDRAGAGATAPPVPEAQP